MSEKKVHLSVEFDLFSFFLLFKVLVMKSRDPCKNRWDTLSQIRSCSPYLHLPTDRNQEGRRYGRFQGESCFVFAKNLRLISSDVKIANQKNDMNLSPSSHRVVLKQMQSLIWFCAVMYVDITQTTLHEANFCGGGGAITTSQGRVHIMTKVCHKHTAPVHFVNWLFMMSNIRKISTL